LVDAPDLGSGIARCGGSSPFARTTQPEGHSIRGIRLAEQKIFLRIRARQDQRSLICKPLKHKMKA
jgi:hypothetical protein